VTVEDGAAILTGTVDSYSEWQAATDNAYEGGAAWVDNDLNIRYKDQSGTRSHGRTME